MASPSDRRRGKGTPPSQQMSFLVASAPAPQSLAGEAAAPPSVTSPAMWQLHDAYILAETRTGVVMVDQHRAHERVLYEELLSGEPSWSGSAQQLLFPATLRLSAGEAERAEEYGALFSLAGYELEAGEGSSLLVKAVPRPHPRFEGERTLRAVVAELTAGSPLVDAARSQHERFALSFACKGSIRSGERLSQGEMAELFDLLWATRHPYHDVHGRPTLVQLSLEELRARFER